jgi:hypothetical protein
VLGSFSGQEDLEKSGYLMGQPVMLEMISGRVWAQSFVTKCEDPAAFMDSFMTVSSCVEIPMTCTPGRKRLIRRVASIPLILGILISMTMI